MSNLQPSVRAPTEAEHWLRSDEILFLHSFVLQLIHSAESCGIPAIECGAEGRKMNLKPPFTVGSHRPRGSDKQMKNYNTM